MVKLCYFLFLKNLYLILQDVKSFVKTCISGNLFIFFEPCPVFFHNVLIDFHWSPKSCSLTWFSYVATFWALGFSSVGCALLPHHRHTHTQKQQGDQQEKYCLLFHLFKCVISTHNIIQVKQVVAAVEKPQPLAKSWGIPKPLLT